MNPSVALAKAYLSLAPSVAPKYWRESKPLQRAQMEYDDELAGGFLKWFPDVDLSGKVVFDIGSGYGGRAARFRELGAKSVTGLEIWPNCVEEAGAFAASRGLSDMKFVLGEGEQLPFDAASFDMVTSYDVFEHVHDLDAAIAECMRVLRPGGRMLAVFPPFYHPTGAHLEAWVSKMPWPNVLFGCPTLIQAVESIMKDRDDGYQPNPMRPKDKLWTLNGATIRSVRDLLQRRGLKKAKMELAPLFSTMNEKWKPWRMKYYAFLFRPLRHVPMLNECFTHRIVLDIVKE